MQELTIATSNPHKVDEISAVLGPLGIRCIPLGRADIPEPEEDGATFEENARIKARAYASALGRVVLADDSGLEVDALGGAPGVHSARYAGIGATREERDRANNMKLLAALSNVPDAQRTARFVCVLSIARPDGRIVAESRGTFDGIIGRAPRGSNGFGYDPLLVLEDGRTSAELSPDEKNARSHRGNALRLILPQLRG
ncbi:MAG: RdgB/HAM1 family non-canonical purine NTP pyrophosphatase [Limnohabitans sp.]|nr:RdgB/HAM1 family non-canonical purine NTP pyrophosphatase [Limnohabitans sp.]